MQKRQKRLGVHNVPHAMTTVRTRWSAEDAELSTPPVDKRSQISNKQRLFAGYRSGEFVVNPIVFSTGVHGGGIFLRPDAGNSLPLLEREQIPPTIQATHEEVLHLIEEIRGYQQPLAEA